MRKFIDPATVSETIIENIKTDRKTMSLNALVFRYKLPYEFISKICKGLSRMSKDIPKDPNINIDATLIPGKDAFDEGFNWI